MGVSVENADTLQRADHLRDVPAAVRFLSCEPLLGRWSLDLDGIDWVIAGGESGPASSSRDQLGARNPRCVPGSRRRLLLQAVGWPDARRRLGRSLDARMWDQYPRVGGVSWRG